MPGVPASHEDLMGTGEDYYKPTKGEDSIYNINNNIQHHEAQLNHLQPNDKLSANVLLQGIGEYKQHLNGAAGNGVASNIDEQRALQLALELSMLGLTNEDELSYGDLRMKKSMNMTECVPVPSSEHVAEIVGRQGCKIKALRAKTNTYIKTPVRGEEPVFVVTGRKEDVGMAKREILQAAEHFSQIRASRRNSTSLSPLGSPSPTAPGHVTKQVRVPYRVVGLVVGPKGSTIKRIQQATNTYIVTPSRDKEPVFEVTGLPENVDRAKREVEQHIALRTGGIVDPTHPESHDHLLNGFASSLFSPTGSSSSGSFSALLDHNHPVAPINHRSQSVESFSYLSGQSSGSSKFSDLGSSATSPFSNNAFFYDNCIIPSPTTDVENGQFDPAPGSPAPSLWPEALQQRNPTATSRPVLINQAPPPQQQMNGNMSMSRYGGGGGGTSMYNTTTDQNNNNVSVSGHTSPTQLRRIMSDTSISSDGNTSFAHFNGATTASVVQQSAPMHNGTNGTVGVNEMVAKVSTGEAPGINGLSNGDVGSPGSPEWLLNKINLANACKQCYVCQNNKIVAALVPCGHNLFCMECAESVKEGEGDCPVCQKQVDAVLRIFT